MRKHWHVWHHIQDDMPPGTLFTVRDLTHLMQRSSVNPLLSFYARLGVIRRVARGVYQKPLRGDWLNRDRPVEPFPPLDEIVRFRARVYGETIDVHGADAARELGFPELPAAERPRYSTSGRTRELAVGRHTVDLRHVPAPFLAQPGTRAGATLLAVHHLDDAESTSFLFTFLSPEDRERVRTVVRRLPARVRHVFAEGEAAARRHVAGDDPALAWPAMTDATERLTALVSGDVQGVGYRAFVRRHALDLGLAGTVENLPDGRVEVVAEGPRSELEHLLIFLRRGPVHAEVGAIDEAWGEGGGLEGFHVY